MEIDDPYEPNVGATMTPIATSDDPDANQKRPLSKMTKGAVFREITGEKSNLTDKSAALRSIFFGLGSTAGPPLGGGLYDSIGWRWTCITMACVSVFFAFVYGTISFCFAKRKEAKKGASASGYERNTDGL